MKYSIVIPTHNHCEDLLRPCVESLIKYTNLAETEIVIVANGCVDGTREYVDGVSAAHANVRMIWSDEALGYTKATNMGIKHSSGQYVVLLNNDCQILHSERGLWMEIMNKPFEDDSVSITGIHEIYSHEINHSFLVFYCVMIRRSMFDVIGYLDEVFSPGFGEDIDFCARLKRAGFKYVNCDPNVQQGQGMAVGSFPIYHAGSSTFHDEHHSAEYERVVARNIETLRNRYSIREAQVKYSIVIPTYNQCDNLLRPCLESIIGTTNLDNVEVIVVANGCTDNTAEYVRSLGQPFKLLTFPDALGYPKATNAGMRAAVGNYIVLLNNDVIIYKSDKNWLDILREPFDTDSKVGMTGPMLFEGVKGFSNDFIMFFCAMTTRKVVDDVGYLDEIFTPGGVEDVDYGLRLTLAGYSLVEVLGDGNTRRSSTMSTGVFPIFHPGCSTVSKVPNWNEILVRNNELLKKKFPNVFNGIDWIEDMKAKRKVYDCFPFFNELDMLELRLEELNDVVDHFVLVEAKLTHQGNPKPLYYQENAGRFEKFASKIIHIVVDDFPVYNRESFKQPWDREQWQRHSITKGLVNCNDNDIIIISDADEIPSRSAILEYMGGGIKSLEQKLYYYDFHHLSDKPWTCAKIMHYSDIKEGNVKTNIDTSFVFSSYLRNSNHPVIKNGGWHFSYCTDVKGIVQKLKSFSHAEYNTAPYTADEYVEMCIKTNKNLFSDAKLTYTEIDRSYPKTVLENMEKYMRLGFIKSQVALTEEFHRRLREIDPFVYNELFEVNVNQMLREDVENKTIIDIGGNKGYFSLHCIELGAKSAHCFEPVPGIYEKLVELTAGFDRIKTYNVAVLDGSLTEVRMHEDGASSNIWGKDGNAIKCISLEEAVAYGDDGSDDMVLKLDCEGSEFEILLNSPRELIRRFSTIFIEIHDEMNPNYVGGTNMLLDHIRDLGYTIEQGPQAGTYFTDDSFVEAPVTIYKLQRIDVERFTFGYINNNADDQRKYLQPSLDALNQDEFDVVYTTNNNAPASNYNKIVDASKTKYVILIHQDAVFPPDLLESIRNTIKQHPDFGVLGLVGFDEFSNLNRLTLYSTKDRTFNIDFFDSFCIIINKEHGLKFDDKTFDNLHMYVEDYCMQAREKGLCNHTVLADFNVRDPNCRIKHIGTTYHKHDGKMWGKYDEYYSIFLKKWVNRINATLHIDSAAGGTTVYNIDDVVSPRIGIVILATGNYVSFVKDLVESINAHFMTDCRKDVLILSDTMSPGSQKLGDNCTVHNRMCRSVTKASYFFELMLENADMLFACDYIFKMDADMLVYSKSMGSDILPGLGKNFSIVKHFAFDQKRMCSIMPDWFSAKLKPEFQDVPGWQSCIFGGRTKDMMAMATELNDMISRDRSEGKMWGAWEEPYVNWYLAQRYDAVRTLSPTYATPFHWHRFPSSYRETYLGAVGDERECIFHYNHTVQFGGHEVG